MNENRTLLRKICHVTGKNGSTRTKNITSIKRIRLAFSRNTETRDFLVFIGETGLDIQK
jgi:hypothetical protein